MQITIATALAAATSAPVSISPAEKALRSQYTLYVWGTFGGGTAKLQISPDNVNWFDTSAVGITAAGAVSVDFSAAWVRLTQTGGASPSLNAMLVE